MGNPAPPAGSYAAMHTRAGYSDGAVLTTAELDAACALLVAQDGSGNAQSLVSERFGFNFIFGTGGGSGLWLVHNAYTVDAGTTWYPFTESSVSFAWQIYNSGIALLYSPALNADGAITWTTVDTFGAGGSALLAALQSQVTNIGPYTGTITHLTTDANAAKTLANPLTAIRDSATLSTDRNLTLAAAQDGWRVIVARNGASGTHNRVVKQADGTTTIKSVADSFTGVFTYDADAALWYLESYAACS